MNCCLLSDLSSASYSHVLIHFPIETHMESYDSFADHGDMSRTVQSVNRKVIES